MTARYSPYWYEEALNNSQKACAREAKAWLELADYAKHQSTAAEKARVHLDRPEISGRTVRILLVVAIEASEAALKAWTALKLAETRRG